MATLCELQTVYSYRDLLDLAEAAMVTGYNEWAAMDPPPGKSDRWQL